MTDKVIPISRAIKDTDQTFMVCPCTDRGSPYLPVIMNHKTSPFIIGLVCPECGSETPVIDGYLPPEDI